MAYDVVSTAYSSLQSIKIVSAKKQSGFSLMELMVVIAIIGIIAVIGTPQFLGMRDRSSVRADARDVHSAYRQAQTEAVKRSYDACVEIDDGVSEYQIIIADYFGTIIDGKSTALPKKELRPGTHFSDVSELAATPYGFIGPCFNSRGLPVEGEGTTITVSSQKSNYTMEISLSHSGHVKSGNQ